MADVPQAEDRFVTVTTLEVKDYFRRHPRTSETTIVSRTDEEMEELVKHLEKHYFDPLPEDWLVRSSLRCPFTGGAVVLSHTSSDFFSEREAKILEQFAEAFSHGYTRFLDFRRLERRNRALQIGRAVASVQSAVAEMTSSADIVRVIVLLSRELEELGLEFTFCSISLVDEENNRSAHSIRRDMSCQST